jgi:hypothetical protein
MRANLLLAICVQQLVAQNAICPVGIVAEKDKASCGSIFTVGSEKSCLEANCCWDAGLFKTNCFVLIGTPEETTTTLIPKGKPNPTTIETITTQKTTPTTAATKTSKSPANSAETAAAAEAEIESSGSSSIGPIIGGVFGLVAVLAFGTLLYNKQKEGQNKSAVIDLHAKTLIRQQQPRYADYGDSQYDQYQQGEAPVAYIQPQQHGYFDLQTDSSFERAQPPIPDSAAAYNHGSRIGFRDPQHPYQQVARSPGSSIGFGAISGPSSQVGRGISSQIRPNSPSSSVGSRGNNPPQSAQYQEAPVAYIQPQQHGYFDLQTDSSFERAQPPIPDSAAAYNYGSRIGFRDPQQPYQQVARSPGSSIGFGAISGSSSQVGRGIPSQIRPNSPSSFVGSRGNNPPPSSPIRANSAGSNIAVRIPSSQVGKQQHPPVSQIRTNSSDGRIPTTRINLDGNASFKPEEDEDEYDWKIKNKMKA